MHRLSTMLLLFLAACGSPSTQPRGEVAVAAEPLASIPVSDLQFTDYGLQDVAMTLAREARLRGIDRIEGRHRIDGLLRLEASLGRSTDAMQRVDTLVAHITATDVGEWAELRRRAAIDVRGKHDDVSRRVQDLLWRWEQEKSESALRYLSSNYERFISGAEWERRFYEFVSRRPMDAATWAWLLFRYRADATRAHYGKANAELAYRHYLVTGGFGPPDEARRVFSVPGIAVETR
jgi:hypothetical protein